MGVIYFNRRPSTDFGIIVESFPSINRGSRRGDGYKIAGRNGTFYQDEATYDNYVQAYDIAIREKNRGAAARCADIAAWLMAPTGNFLRLEDTFEPEYYKLARFAGPLNIKQILGHVGRCTLEFECQPERWLKSGEIPIETTSTSLTIHNPTLYRAKPLITITRTGTTDISIGNTSYMSIAGATSYPTVVIDCDAGTIRSGTTNLYGTTTFYRTYNDFPTLAQEVDTTINATNATKISVVPRWYVL